MQRLALLAAAATALQRPPVIRRVEVEVTRQLDGVSPEHAREAWLDYSWTSGGGIPALVLREPADAKLPSVRTLVPAGLREELAYVDQTDDELVARYRVSDPGPLLGVDVVNGSHTGLVAFAPTKNGCEMRWEVSFDCRGRAGFWKEATELLVGNAADALQALVAQPSKPYWFDPLAEFGLTSDGSDDKPLLLVLPGLDGSSVTAWMQYPELGEAYDLRCLVLPANCRGSYEDWVNTAVEEVEKAALRAEASRLLKKVERPVFVLGESMGAGVALDVAARSSVAGAVLVSPATGWDRTALGGARERLIRLPDPVLAVIIALSSYQLLDRGQLDTTLRRIATGETSPLLEGEDREAYAWRVVGELPQRLALPASACRHRMREWVGPSIAAGSVSALAKQTAPLLIVAGTADLRVPAEEEARRIQKEAPPRCLPRLHLVEGAGHAGATDDRLDLRAVMDAWRREVVGV